MISGDDLQDNGDVIKTIFKKTCAKESRKLQKYLAESIQNNVEC